MAWLYSNGKGVTIAIIDTGVNNDYNLSLISGFNSLTNTTSDTSDDNGHGTIVAGLAAGNGPKYYGIAPAAKIMPVSKIITAQTSVRKK
jgi:subtilisin family serine protease